MNDSEKLARELLEGAYALATPDDNVSYYRDFARHYDNAFAQEMGYQLPHLVAQTYQELAEPSDQTIVDLGCGTGLVAEFLPSGTLIDGLDISEDMLAAARSKGRYRKLFRLDLTQPIPPSTPKYQSIISSGTFTHGHLGPDALENALSLGYSNALFILSVNSEHFRTLGFKDRLNKLSKEGLIADVSHRSCHIYTDHTHAHAGDEALICSFRKS